MEPLCDKAAWQRPKPSTWGTEHVFFPRHFPASFLPPLFFPPLLFPRPRKTRGSMVINRRRHDDDAVTTSLWISVGFTPSREAGLSSCVTLIPRGGSRGCSNCGSRSQRGTTWRIQGRIRTEISWVVQRADQALDPGVDSCGEFNSVYNRSRSTGGSEGQLQGTRRRRIHGRFSSESRGRSLSRKADPGDAP